MSVKYSIVIPTRNRLEYLPYAAQSVLDSNRDDIELIVSNNHSSDGTDKFLSELKDSRLRVIQPSVVLPMAGHYEFAINEARGDWITLLGDDDAVMPYIFGRLDHYIAQFPKADIISSARAYYFWEGCEDLYGSSVVNYRSKQVAAYRSTKQDLEAVLKGKRSCFDMPQIYTTSMIKRSLYQEIIEKSGGCFYHSIIPDMYSVVAICLSREKYLRVEEPLFWVGTSNKSLGRTDRIYRDAEQFESVKLNAYSCVPRKISNQVSYKIHSSGFSPMYIYECILQSPLKSKFYDSKRIYEHVFSAILLELNQKSAHEREKIFLEIKNESKKHNLSMIRILLFYFITYIEIKLRWFFNIPNRLINRFITNRNTIKFQSNCRQKFPTIKEASSKIVEIRTKSFV